MDFEQFLEKIPTWAKISGVIFLVLLFFSGVLLIWTFSALNAETKLRNNLIQRNEVVKVEYSTGYKILTDQLSLKQQEDAVLKDIYLGVVEGRYKNDQNVLFKMVTEQNPNVDRTMAKGFFNSLEIYFNQRAQSFRDLAVMKDRHNTMLESYPNAIIYWLFGRGKIRVTYVTDSNTQKSFETGTDDTKIVN